VKRWQVIAAALLLFATGAGSGYFVARAGAGRPQAARAPAGLDRAAEARFFALRRIQRELDLQPAQRERIEALIRDSQGRMRKIFQEVQPRAREEMKFLREQIRRELTPEQRQDFERLLRRPEGRPGEPRNPESGAGRPPAAEPPR
jgi:Spy/CpxP family protein refolding chaperone